MKTGKLFLVAAFATLMGCQSTPSVADVNAHISLGGPRAIAYHPIYHSDYFYNAGYAPDLLFIPQLGFYVSVGLPYDLLFFNNFYYVYHSGYWYHSRYYRGPWAVVKHNRLPYVIRQHRWHKIRDYCNREYRSHNKHRWLKHRHEIYKEKRRSIRNSAYYHDTPRSSHKVYRGKIERERQKAYRIKSEHERRKAYKVRLENERKKAYKVRTEPEKRIIYKERKKTKTWRKNPDERIVVKEKTTKTKRWTKQENNRKEKRWADGENMSRVEKKGKHKDRAAEYKIKRWTRIHKSR